MYNYCKFKVGDIVKGLKWNGFSITNENMKAGEVVSVFDDSENMQIALLEHPELSVGVYLVPNDPRKFAYVNPMKEMDTLIAILKNRENHSLLDMDALLPRVLAYLEEDKLRKMVEQDD